MPKNILKLDPLPPIDVKLGEDGIDSSLTRFSNGLNSLLASQKEEKPQRKYKFRKKLLKQRSITESNESTLNQCKMQIAKLRHQLERRSIERSLAVDDKFRRLTKLTYNQATRTNQSPRSSYNYISLQPAPLPQQPYIYPPPHYFVPPYMPRYSYPPPYNSDDYYDEPERLRSSNHRKYRKKHTQQKDEEPEEERKNSPVAQKTKSSYNPALIFKKKIGKRLLKKWRAAVWMILFTKLLPNYSKKIQNMRVNILQKFQKRNFNTEMLLLQKYLVKKCKPFFLYIFNRKQIEFQLKETQTSRMQDEKAQAVKRLINMLIDGLNSIRLEDKNEPGLDPVELIHMFCKHGAFVCNKLMTEQELNMVTISENGYIRMDKNMEKSQIINFLYSKILLYNIILHPQKVDKEMFGGSEILSRNFYFIGSIWYELCIEVQDEYLAKVPTQNFPMGNWKKYRQKFKIDPTQSLSVNKTAPDKDQMVTGLLSKQKIDKIFGINFWRKQKINIKISVERIHQLIVKFHQKLKQSTSL